MARTGCKHPEPAIRATAGSPGKWCPVFQQPQAFGDHLGKDPDPVPGIPLGAAGQQQLASRLGRGWNLKRDERSVPGCDRRRLSQQFDGGKPGVAVCRDPVSHAHQGVSMTSSEAFGAILLRGIGLGDTEVTQGRCRRSHRWLAAWRHWVGTRPIDPWRTGVPGSSRSAVATCSAWPLASASRCRTQISAAPATYRRAGSSAPRSSGTSVLMTRWW